eukprot:10282686-Karenia_brevis.AAC.1
MEIFVPKGTKRSKCARTAIMLLYVKMLRAAHELDEILKNADNLHFDDDEDQNALQLVPLMSDESPKRSLKRPIPPAADVCIDDDAAQCSE